MIPLFVRDGGIVPLVAISAQGNDPGEATPLEVRHYGAGEGAFLLYDDDGETLAYERGLYNWTELRAERSGDGRLAGSAKPIYSRVAPTYGSFTWRWMSAD